MARKTLLTEAELRSFMKLAELRPIGDDRIKEMYGQDEDDVNEGESVQDDDPAGKSLEEEEMEMDMKMGDDDAPGAPDIGDAPDMDMGADAGAGKMVSIDDFMGALEAALEDVLDDDVEVDMDDDDDDMRGMDDDDDDDAPGDLGAMGGMGDSPMMEEEDIVNEVARRVAARLQNKQQNAEMVDQLAERILNRLTSK